jgi:hypothetical protein
VVAALAGSSLAVAGLLMQGIFRNPLADPGIIGMGAGANLGGIVAMVGYEAALASGRLPLPHEMFLPLGCILGALGALGVLIVVTRISRDAVTVLLAGVIMGMLLASIGAAVQAVVGERWELARAIMTFTMGDITGKGPGHVALAAPVVAAGLLAAWCLRRLLPGTSRRPARPARFLAKFRETAPEGLPSFARQNPGTRSGAYVEYVSRPDYASASPPQSGGTPTCGAKRSIGWAPPSAAKRSQKPRSAGVLAAKIPAVVLAIMFSSLGGFS